MVPSHGNPGTIKTYLSIWMHGIILKPEEVITKMRRAARSACFFAFEQWVQAESSGHTLSNCKFCQLLYLGLCSNCTHRSTLTYLPDGYNYPNIAIAGLEVSVTVIRTPWLKHWECQHTILNMAKHNPLSSQEPASSTFCASRCAACSCHLVALPIQNSDFGSASLASQVPPLSSLAFCSSRSFP